MNMELEDFKQKLQSVLDSKTTIALMLVHLDDFATYGFAECDRICKADGTDIFETVPRIEQQIWPAGLCCSLNRRRCL
jgi:hypothetical protein